MRSGLLRGHRPIRVAGFAGALLCAMLAGIGAQAASAKPHIPEALYVGSFHGIVTPPSVTFSTIQGAVDAAQKGDWILIAPGDYHETGDMGANSPSPSDLATGWYGGVDIETADDPPARYGPQFGDRRRNARICSHAMQFGSRRPELPQRRRAQWHPRVEDQRRQCRQPHRVQLPRRLRRLWQ